MSQTNRILLNDPTWVKAGTVKKKVIVHCILTVWYLDRLITLTSWKHPLIHKYNPTNKGYLKTHFPEYISIIWLVTFYLINKKLKLNNTNLNSYFPKSVFAQKKKKKSYGVDIKLTFLRTSFSCRWSGSSLPEYTSLWSFVD